MKFNNFDDQAKFLKRDLILMHGKLLLNKN